MDIARAAETPPQDGLGALIAQGDAALLALTPAQFCVQKAVERITGLKNAPFIARRNGRVMVWGARRWHPGGIGEVKRRHNRPNHRVQPIDGRILERIESKARHESLDRLLPKTGNRHCAAWRVFQRASFESCGPMREHRANLSSIFDEKRSSSGR